MIEDTKMIRFEQAMVTKVKGAIPPDRLVIESYM